MTPEGKVKQQVKKYLNEKGIWSFMPVQNGMGVIGIPDIICCRPVRITQDMVGETVGLFLAIETKAPGKKWNTSPNQKRNLKAIADHYGTAVVADCVEDVEVCIDGHCGRNSPE